jgi:hypothetical protein
MEDEERWSARQELKTRKIGVRKGRINTRVDTMLYVDLLLCKRLYHRRLSSAGQPYHCNKFDRTPGYRDSAVVLIVEYETIVTTHSKFAVSLPT